MAGPFQVFAFGAVDIEFGTSGPTPAATYTLGFGQSATVTIPMVVGAATYDIAVDAFGAITVTCTDFSTTDANVTADLSVTPAAGFSAFAATDYAATDPGVGFNNSATFYGLNINPGGGGVHLLAAVNQVIDPAYLWAGDAGTSPYAQFGITDAKVAGVGQVIAFEPLLFYPSDAPDASFEATGAPIAYTPVITANGNPVVDTQLALSRVSNPAHGTLAIVGGTLTYTPTAGYVGADSYTYSAALVQLDSSQSDVDLGTGTVTITAGTTDTANCDCDDTTGNKTLAQLRSDLMVRLGFAAQKDNPPPGMADLLNSFLIEAQELLYRRYDVLRTLRFYSWTLQAGVKFYDINANVETCSKRLDPRKVEWVGVQVAGLWYPLECGIAPELYSQNPGGRPLRYEMRQCIEVWPVPDATEGTLVIKGDFGLEPFAADADTTTIDDRLVFLLALANAKAHYGRPDANNYIAQMEQMMLNLVAGSHQTRRYIPGRPRMFDMAYTAPKPTVPFS